MLPQVAPLVAKKPVSHVEIANADSRTKIEKAVRINDPLTCRRGGYLSSAPFLLNVSLPPRVRVIGSVIVAFRYRITTMDVGNRGRLVYYWLGQ